MFRKSAQKIPSCLYPGPTEKRIGTIHIVVGLVAMPVQLVLFSFDILHWYHTTGLCSPILFMIIGYTYGAIMQCDESRKEFLHDIVEPRVAPITDITERDRARFIQLNRSVRRMFLVIGYMGAVLFQLLWSSVLMNVSEAGKAGLFMIFPAFLMFMIVDLEVTGIILTIIRYRDISYLLEAERAITREWMRSSNKSTADA